MGVLVDVIVRLLALGLNSQAVKDMIRKIRNDKGRDLTPQEYADEMKVLADQKAAEARAAVNPD